MNIENILSILKNARMPVHKEKELQEIIKQHFDKNNIEYQREYCLDSKNIPDFFIDGIVIEIKVKGPIMQIYRQCVRYMQFDEAKQLILITNRALGWPDMINNKPCYILNLGRAWL